MNIEEQIKEYIDSQDDPKRSDMHTLHQQIIEVMPKSKLWFLDGKYNTGKVITNPNIGYGQFTIYYKDGSNKEFYQIGISGNTTGISVYIMGLEDKKYLSNTFGITIGKANVTSYCIKFKTLKDINIEILKNAIKYGIDQTDKD
jgi:Domain of unknown function (DU1801)